MFALKVEPPIGHLCVDMCVEDEVNSSGWFFEFFNSGLEVALRGSNLDNIAAQFRDHSLNPSA